MIVNDIIAAVGAGKELANATTWKNRQLVVSRLAVIVGAAVSVAGLLGYKIPLTAEDLSLLIGAVGVLAGVFNSVATAVSTTRVGLSPSGRIVVSGTPDGAGHQQSQRERVGEYDDDSAYPMPDMKDKG